jgi:galactoside O-acetyltransferase
MSSELKTEEELSELRQLGKDCTIFRLAQLIKPEVISIGRGCQIDDFSWIHGGQGLDIGDRVHICAFASIAGGGKVTIGNYAGLSAGVRVISGSENPFGKGLTNPCIPPEYRSVKRSFVSIGEHALIFTNTIILPGVSIGDGAIAMPGSVVRDDLDAWGIYKGDPAEKISVRRKDRIESLTVDMVQKYGY